MGKKILIAIGITLLIVFSSFQVNNTFGLKKQTNHHLKDGDIIFIVNPSGQGKAIQLATKSKYTHVGIIFIENDTPYVYHAVEPVTKSTLKEFVEMSTDNNYSLRRLKNQSLLTKNIVNEMRADATKKLGTHYDLAFNWGNDELYCSEYVWKIYYKALALEIGKLKPLKSFDLSHPKVKEIMEFRYGDEIPYDEKMISPGDMYSSDLLEDIKLQ